MSWMQSRQQQQQQQGPTPPAAQTSSAVFSGQQQWHQSNYNNQTLQQPSQNQNSWYNSGQSSLQPGVRNPPQNWQRQNSPYFTKNQQQQQLPIDNYMQHQQQYPSQPHPQQQQQPFQTASYQQTQSRQSAVVQANGPVNTQQYVKPEQMSQAPSQGFDSFDNQTNDGWGDFDWNDNNQVMQGSVDDGSKHASQNLIEESFKTEPNDNWQWSVEEKPTITLPGENKKLENVNSQPDVRYLNSGRQDVSNDSSQNYFSKPDPAPVVGRQDLMSESPALQNYDEHSYKPTSFSQTSFGQHQVSIQPLKNQPNQQMVHSTPVSTPQRNQQILSQDAPMENAQHPATGNIYLQTSKSLESGVNQGVVPHSKPAENSQNSVGSPVYVSQAKPVSQPPRQYAMSPSVSGESTPILQPAAGSKSLPIASSNQIVNPPPALGSITTPHPGNSQSPGLSNLPPPPSQTPPQLNNSANSVLPPPPPIVQTTSAVSNNPYKRTGVAQHHRSLVALPKSSQQSAVIPQQFFAPPPEEFQTQQNQEYLAPDNSEVVDRNFEVENQEVAPSNDRNRYLQTSHLSEEGYNNNRQDIGGVQEQNNEFDSFPPPGLSRLVLGQPEVETTQQSSLSQPEIPPGLDRMIPGTELAASDLNMERQADGQDTIPSPRSAFTNVPPVEENSSANIDITADRNLYLVPGESDVQVQRVVTGVENGLMSQGAGGEQREVELDGENLEDQQQQQHQAYQHEVEITREEPIEGANTLDGVGGQSANHETESSLTLDTNLKDLSNASTGNDESDHRDRNSYLNKSKRSEDKKRRPDMNMDKRKDRYDSEESDLSSERERRRYREGSVRNDRGRDSKDRDRKDKRESRERDRYRDEEDGGDRRYDRDRRRDKYDRERDRGRYDRDRDRDRNRYETDSRYETEGSMRYERRRNDRDRDRDRDRYDNEYRRDEKDRRYRRDRRGDDREDRDRDRERDRRRGDRDYRDDRDRRRERDLRDKTRSDYDDDGYRKSRNERDKDRLREKDPRYAHMYNYPQGYSYDMYYQQQQKYYEQLRRTNPQAYSEWYHKYYAQMQGQDMMTNDGRESVHSGRSSANNEKERYSIQAVRQYLQQPNEYHRPSLNSTLIGETPYNIVSGPSSGNLSQHLQHHQLPGGFLIPTSNRSYYAQSEYSESTRHENMSLNLMDESMSIQDPQRTTPCKFPNEHPTVSLSAGILVCVKPKYSQNGITNIVKILKLGGNDSHRRLFQTFPGPLIRGLTHKKTIIEFCEDQIRLGPPSITLRSRQNSISSICSVGQANKASFTLMWNLLILLLRQNGMVVGTDIAELLMKNKVQFPYDIQNFASKSISRRDSVQSEVRKSKENSPSDGENEVEPNENSNGHTLDEGDGKESLSEEEITEKFRNYLLYGNVNEALEWATDNNLWGHALFLASKVDRRSHANVMMKFANKLALNDPLQTLYQLMSGRSPSSVTSVQDEKWGDWRPHLAMILSNTSQKPELNRKAITTLGDSLYNRGDLFGAQFCYLMAQVEFGRYSAVNQDSTLMPNSPNAIRLVLLGSSQHKCFKEFATNEAIMMTEIYEYACSLNDDKFSIVEFQPYKYLLALRMLDYGFQLKTLMYMEQIAIHIQRDPSKYDLSFIEKVYKLADRLKYYDPVLEKTVDDQDANQSWSGLQFEDQQWLQDLRNVLTETSAANGLLQNNSCGFDYNNGQAPQHPSGELDNKTLIDQQFSEINQQFSELSMQYNNFDPMQQLTGYQTGNDAEYQQQQQQQSQQQQQQQQQIPNQTHDQYGQFYGSKPMYNNVQDANSSGYGNGVVQSGYMQSQQTAYDHQNQMHGVNQEQHQMNQGYDGYWSNQQQQNQQNQQQNELEESNEIDKIQQSPPSTTYENPSQTTLENPVSNSEPKTTITDGHSNSSFDKNINNLKKSSINPQSTPSPVPLTRLEGRIGDSSKLSTALKQQQHQQRGVVGGNQSHYEDDIVHGEVAEDIQRPTISMPNSMSSKPGFYDDSQKDENSSHDLGNQGKSSTNDTRKASVPKIDGKIQNKSIVPSNSNSGWFGGIWNKLSLKPKNQMILPDDKNPTIVWDSEKKRWVNTEGDDDEHESFKPPPKLSDIMNAQNNKTSTQASNMTPQTQQQTTQQSVPQQHNHQQQQQQQQIPFVSTQQSNAPATVPQPAPSPMSAVAANGNASGPVETNKTPSLQSNMFKMQRNRTLKKSYVDVFNPSGAQPSKPVEPVLAPTVPPAAVPQSGFFIPAPVSADDSQPQQDGAPQFYNPNQFGGYQQ